MITTRSDRVHCSKLRSSFMYQVGLYSREKTRKYLRYSRAMIVLRLRHSKLFYIMISAIYHEWNSDPNIMNHWSTMTEIYCFRGMSLHNWPHEILIRVYKGHDYCAVSLLPSRNRGWRFRKERDIDSNRHGNLTDSIYTCIQNNII